MGPLNPFEPPPITEWSDICRYCIRSYTLGRWQHDHVEDLEQHCQLGGTNGEPDNGFQVTIGGIRANASTVGDGEDIVAVVSVAGGVVHSGSDQSRGRDNRTGS